MNQTEGFVVKYIRLPHSFMLQQPEGLQITKFWMYRHLFGTYVPTFWLNPLSQDLGYDISPKRW